MFAFSPNLVFYIRSTTISLRGRRGRDRIVVGSTTIYAISVYHHLCCEFESRSWQGVLDTTLCDNFVNDLRQVGGFLLVFRFPPPIKLTATISVK